MFAILLFLNGTAQVKAKSNIQEVLYKITFMKIGKKSQKNVTGLFYSKEGRGLETSALESAMSISLGVHLIP